MQGDSAWYSEARSFLLIIATSGATGYVLDWTVAGLWVGVAAYVARHLRYLHALIHWLQRRRVAYPPDGEGIWGEVFRRLSVRQKDDRLRIRRLARMVARFQQSTRAIPDGLVMLDSNQQIEWCNVVAGDLVGIRAPEDYGLRPDHFVRHPDFADFLQADTGNSLTMRSPQDLQKVLEIRKIPIADGNTLLIVADATERYLVEHMRKDFVADASHELRTPLTVLSGYLENINRMPENVPDTWQRPVQVMTEQATRMGHIVEDLLMLARMEGSASLGTQAEVIDVLGLLSMLVEDARELSGERGHHISLKADPTVRLRAVPDEIRTVFSNLLANAVTYTPDGGNVLASWSVDSNGAYFEVTDDGVGIAPEHVPRLTERFFRADKGRSRQYGGTGLGLSIVKHILERHNGRLHIESVVGEGSVFRCEFPCELVELQSEGSAPSMNVAASE